MNDDSCAVISKKYVLTVLTALTYAVLQEEHFSDLMCPLSLLAMQSLLTVKSDLAFL